MKLELRRRGLLPGLAALAVPTSLARAQEGWPQRAIRIVLPYAPGGSTDASARLVAAPMTQSLGQPMVVENRPGATGTLGAAEIARAPKDGYNLLVDAAAHGSNHALYRNLPFDYARDFAPITQLTVSPQILAVHPSLPVNSVAELVALAKQQPGALSYGTPGNGSAGHLACASLAWHAGMDVTQVAYRGGGPAVQDLLANQISFTFASVSAVLALVQDGKLRPLAVSSLSRIAPLPQVPAIAETYPGFDINEWAGLYAPVGTPDAVLEQIGAAARAALAVPEVRQRLDQLGAQTVGSSRADFTAWLTQHRLRMSELVQVANIRPD
ncbi:tripartite tricarboxylate transporter substrate binding protein [Pseudoroseomonas wenyumeiae]|uniref:Tripartite tricarboxylate transporter substrate binding protein n=1 Tax=Teichococcus wenyumeiae TaxID=2478470 RepID=A0A3A9JFM6_9PROT|nr:tripartite tricarboxylate transporter substrate binding protein [Pseudoroseomonas wenyumeiae]RKK04141.1 tripartite tricarboxylate transporter substrate binding protein [Pseudoroseomonas wenyumeiae]RMI17165.1 tripartite tricarboxylate transporter substrate binding protein [Pseudoroseomonas wenyumeiae]